NNELAVFALSAEKQVPIVAQMSVVSVLHPLLLHELELAEKAGAQSHENNPTVNTVIRLLFIRDIRPIGKTASHNAPAVDERAIKPERVPGIRAADVGTDGTANSFQILAVSEIRDTFRFFFYEVRNRIVRVEFGWRPVAPSTNKF